MYHNLIIMTFIIIILRRNNNIFYTVTMNYMLSPRRFELLHIPHQEIILPLNYRL